MRAPRARPQLVIFRTTLGLGAGLLLLASMETALAQSGSPPPKSPAPSPTPLEASKAVFADHALNGKDPFFPDSQRRHPPAQANPANPFNQPAGLLAQVVLKGISWNKDRRLAVLNNVTLAEGEKGPVRVNAQIITLQCLEIRERSVLISMEGSKEVREIQFPRDF
jgi:hypothetical protein